jgi:hypothetical protein
MVFWTQRRIAFVTPDAMSGVKGVRILEPVIIIGNCR